MPAKDPTAAERQRRYRYRQRHDLLLARAEVPAAMAEDLIDAGLLAEEAASDPQALGEALVAAAKRPMHSG